MLTTAATGYDIVTRALRMIGNTPGGQAPSAEDQSDALDILNGMLDSWAMERLFIFNNSIDTYALTSGQQDYDIGPTAVAPFNVVRPSRILKANLVVTSQSPATYLSLNLLDDDGWMDIVVRNISSTYPIALYYSASYPNGQLRFWPKPQSGLSVELQTWTTISQFAALSTAFSFPPGYFEAIYQNLALAMCTPEWGFESVPQSIEARANASRARIQALNMNPPPQMSPDVGAGGVRQDSGYRNLYSPQPYWSR